MGDRTEVPAGVVSDSPGPRSRGVSRIFAELGKRDVVMMLVGILAGGLISIPAGEIVARLTAAPAFQVSVSAVRYEGSDLVVDVRNSGTEAAVVHRVAFKVTELRSSPDDVAGGCLAHTDPAVYEPAKVMLSATSLAPGQVVPGSLVADGTASSGYAAPTYADIRVGGGGVATFVVHFDNGLLPSRSAVATGALSVDVDGGDFLSDAVTLDVPDHCGNFGNVPDAPAGQSDPLPVAFRRT